MKFPIGLIVKKGKIFLWGFLLAGIFWALFPGQFIFAAEVSLFAGGEIDNRGQGFSYLGVDLTQRINKTISLSGRIAPNYLAYQYYSGDNLVRASSPGLQTIAGIKLFWGQTMLGVWGGVEFRDTNLNPDDNNASLRGNTSAGLIQGEFDTWLPSRTNLNVYASYSGTSNFTYEKGKVRQQITNLDFKKSNTINVGIEQFFGRNPDFQMVGVGLTLDIFHIPHWLGFGVRAGYKHDSTFGNGVYGGLDFYKKF